ncbi:MAG: hypothetical protein NC113_09640 [Bacteroides sp.]|nr:hypothetical protein [Bacteroides sp.]MCM1448456.1 hypothetical protein [Bacteroides sp.]MCM1511323.1 hypothetical protein [Clostridium sp.]
MKIQPIIYSTLSTVLGAVFIVSAVAEYEYVSFDDVPQNRLYWLENKSQGGEEMPFVLDKDGKQMFIYYDIVDIYKNKLS